VSPSPFFSEGTGQVKRTRKPRTDLGLDVLSLAYMERELLHSHNVNVLVYSSGDSSKLGI
jgi:hypothetical protein